MSSFKDQMAKKVQAAARGYIARKTGIGGKKTAGKKTGKPGKAGGKKAKKSDDMNAQIIQAAFRKYKEYKKQKH